jgi:glycolate oxidase FAD binding subunit
MGGVLDAAPPKSIARAGSGVTYAAFEDAGAAAQWASKALEPGCKAVVEFAPCARKAELELWPSPGPDLDIMMRIKRLFDPRELLNRGRLYGRI